LQKGTIKIALHMYIPAGSCPVNTCISPTTVLLLFTIKTTSQNMTENAV